MVNLGEEHDRLVGITAAMKEGTGLVRFENEISWTDCLMWESQRSMLFLLQQDWHLAG